MATSTVVQLLTSVDAARHLGISRSKLHELLDAGELPPVRTGRTRRIARSALNEIIADHTGREPAQTPA